MKNSLLLVLLLMAQLVSAAEKITFVDNDWKKATAEAKKQNKYLFVDAYTDWCYWCKVMDKQTFVKEEVAAVMNKNFVALKLEMEHNYGKTVAMKYRVKGFPSYLIFNPNGKLVYRTAGYMEAKAFIGQLNDALDPAKQSSPPGISDKIELEFPDFYVAAFNENGKREFPDSMTLMSYLNKQQDLYNEVNYNVLAQFASTLPVKYQQHFLNHQTRYTELYGKEDVSDVVASLAYQKLQTAIDDTSEAELNNTMTFIDKYMKGEKGNAEIKSWYNINYYEKTGNWKKFSAYVDEYLKANPATNGETINRWSWDVYEKSDDKETIEKALGWIKPVIESTPKYYSMDTYAALLFKAKRFKEAETYALKAIELGKKEGEKTEATEKLLGEIRKGK